MLKKKKQLIALVLLANLACCLFGANTFAYTASITTDGLINIDVSATGNNANIGTDTINVVSTCPLGYTVSISGPSNNSLYLNGDSASASSISASTGTRTTPVSILGNNLGTWGYTAEANTTVNSNFIGLTNTATLLTTKASASATGGDNITVSYGVSVTSSTTPGTYTLAESSQGANDDAIVYALIPEVGCAGATIRYNDNGANSTTTMGITHFVELDDEVILAASNFKRQGYGFAGWSTVALNADSATFQSDLAAAKAAGNVFGPNETITINTALLSQATAVNNDSYLTMYAIWVKPAQNATLQGWHGCSSLNTGDVIALTDSRDNQAYAVAKLVDGNCWMIENLRLENTYSTDTFQAQGFGGVFSGLANPETANFSYSTTANSKYSTSNITGSSQTHRFPRYNNSNTNSTVSNMTATNQNIYSYGNYYSYAAAIANTSLISTDNTSPTTSICPADWMLPKGGDKTRIESNNDNDFWNLIANGLNGGVRPSNYNNTNNPAYEDDETDKKLRKFPNNFIYSGEISGDSIDNRGFIGSCWSATTGNDLNAYSLGFYSNPEDAEIRPATSAGSKATGLPIRCIATKTYTVSFNANGGSGTMSDQYIAVGAYVPLNPNTLTATGGKYFHSWNTAPDGSGTLYYDVAVVNDLAAAGETITLYAQWKTILYDAVASMTKGTQTAADLQTAISTSNSGVYTYNSPVFTTSTDAGNGNTIYYYRGILDNTTGTYGSNGDGAAWPNYVRLGNTCWRIVRTTGSGGVKIIYNGNWTGSTCANATTSAQLSSTSRFSGTSTSSSTARQIVRVGYTYNNSYANTSTTGSTSYTTVMGSNTSFGNNTTNSTIKGNIETWYTSNLSSYASMLEDNAGFCNDRTSYTTATGTTATSNIRPYTTSTNTGSTYVAYFAARRRNASSSATPSLACPSGRSTVDVYTTSSATAGNKQLGAPIGLLTADELSFAGSGSNTASNGSAYNSNSFLNTGSNFWTMSPYERTGGYAYNFYLNSSGYQASARIDTAYGVRPVISLNSSAYSLQGDGTATNPWIVEAP